MTVQIEMPYMFNDESLNVQCDESTTVMTALTNSSITSSSTIPELLGDFNDSSEHGDVTKIPVGESQHKQHKEKQTDTQQCGHNPFAFFSSNESQRRRKGSRNNLIAVTEAELSRHNCVEHGIWISCGTSVYDVTNYIKDHPGGVKSILRKSGGKDCSRDMKFHSPKAIKMWKSMKIGFIVQNSESQCHGTRKPFMNINNDLEILEQTEQCVIS